MGFRSRRRHKGGGGGGGGGGGHGGGGQGFAWTGEANGLQPGDDVGNRKSFKPVIVPPEDIGNRRDPDEEDDVPFDDVGNRIEANPTHEVSGILLDMDPKKRKRRAKGAYAAPPERVGRYVVGGVNPIIAGGNRMPPQPPEEPMGEVRAFERPERPERQPQGQQQPQQDRKKKFEQVDGRAAQEVSEKRVQRFFDFEEDDRFDYTLKSTPEQKRAEALRFVDDVLRESGRNAIVQARIIEDGDKPKLLVTIDEKGPHGKLAAERIPSDANEPLFVMGNAALMSLNYLANKVVNRYPDDRIRLAVLPASDEKLYLESLVEHQKRSRADAPSSSSPSPFEPAVEPAAPLLPAAAVVEAAEVQAEAPAPKKGRRRGKGAEADAAGVPAAPVAAPVAVAAPAAEPAPVVAEPVPVVPVVVAPMVVEPPPPARGRRGGGAKKKPSEEIIPPPSALPPEPVAVEPPPPPPEEAPRGRRRAPPDDLFPSRPAAFDDRGDRGDRGPPRPRPRRGGPSLVEVVRVTKKT